ncbi:autotransporter outer membrane beta-barrel domain-containing protein [Neisseria weaveri]|uniref:autotransporter outer membrane beta-barrel domain-containing protein n=1 Tax=Neisseria weaveri TaxID=28091 RepID=UPI000D30B614|nr:autotransporter outer membrane beta-barrel domain-containing protein [Neisseria weaveri]
MNHTFASIYDPVKGTYVAVAETTKRKGKPAGSAKIIAACIAAACLSATAYAAPITLTGDYVRTAVNDRGTLGSGYSDSPGMQYDKTGKRNFGIDDYLTPGTPFQIFSVKTKETGLATNDNNGTQQIETVEKPRDISSGDRAAVSWSGKYDDFYTVNHQYSVDKTEQGIRVETKLTALKNLTEVKFLTALDPDPDVNTYASHYTINGRGTSKFKPEDWVHSLGQKTGLPVGIYSNSSYKHNTGVSEAWTDDPDFYLSGKMEGNGDYAIGMGFDIGTLDSGKSADLVYYYLMNETLDKIDVPPSSGTTPVPPVTKSNIDLKKPFYDGSQLGITVNPAFEGGTLRTDKEGMYASNFTINPLGGRINADGKATRFVGTFADLDAAGSGTFTVADEVGGGSVTFEGANTYTGKTVIDGTALSLAKSGSLASSSGVELAKAASVFDVSGVTGGATVVKDLSGVGGSTVRTGTTVLTAGTAQNTEFAGKFEGSGGYVKAGSGRMLLSGDSTAFTGANRVDAGELRVDGKLGGQSLIVADQAVLSGSGTVGGLVTAKSGSLIVPGADKQNTLVFSDGLQAEAGSKLMLQTTLNGDDSATDKLVVEGDTAGNITVEVANLGGAGAKTKEGIKVVEVKGRSEAVFNLSQPKLTVDSYEYRLVKNGLVTPNDGNWYLRNTFRSGVANYLTASAANSTGGLALLSTMHQRNGKFNPDTDGKAETWARLISSRDKQEGGRQFSYKQNLFGVQIGRNLWQSGGDKPSRAGVTVQYLRGNADTYDRDRNNVSLGTSAGEVKSHTGGIGVYHTVTGASDWYVDSVAQINYVSNTLKDDEKRTSKLKGMQYGLSVEAGKPYVLANQWKIEPQAQLSYLYTDYRNASDDFAKVKVKDADSLRLRVGARVDKQFEQRDTNVYALVNLHHDFADKNRASFTHPNGGVLKVKETFKRSGIEAGLGVQTKLGSNSYLYSDLRRLHRFGGKGHQTNFNIGIKAKF